MCMSSHGSGSRCQIYCLMRLDSWHIKALPDVGHKAQSIGWIGHMSMLADMPAKPALAIGFKAMIKLTA